MIVPTITFDTSKHCACETPLPATFTDRCLACGGMLAVPEANTAAAKYERATWYADETLGEAFSREKAEPAKASDARLTWSLDALEFIMGQTFKRPTEEFERAELVRRAKELGLLGEERPR